MWCEGCAGKGRPWSKQTRLRKVFQLDWVPNHFSGQRGDSLPDKKIKKKKAAHHPPSRSWASSQARRTMISSLLNLIISSYLLEACDTFSLVANVQEEATLHGIHFFLLTFAIFHQLSQHLTS